MCLGGCLLGPRRLLLCEYYAPTPGDDGRKDTKSLPTPEGTQGAECHPENCLLGNELPAPPPEGPPSLAT